MLDDFEPDYERSAQALREVVISILQQHCPAFRDKEVIVFEDRHNSLQRDLDVVGQ